MVIQFVDGTSQGTLRNTEADDNEIEEQNYNSRRHDKFQFLRLVRTQLLPVDSMIGLSMGALRINSMDKLEAQQLNPSIFTISR